MSMRLTRTHPIDTWISSCSSNSAPAQFSLSLSDTSNPYCPIFFMRSAKLHWLPWEKKSKSILSRCQRKSAIAVPPARKCVSERFSSRGVSFCWERLRTFFALSSRSIGVIAYILCVRLASKREVRYPRLLLFRATWSHSMRIYPAWSSLISNSRNMEHTSSARPSDMRLASLDSREIDHFSSSFVHQLYRPADARIVSRFIREVYSIRSKMQEKIRDLCGFGFWFFSKFSFDTPWFTWIVLEHICYISLEIHELITLCTFLSDSELWNIFL